MSAFKEEYNNVKNKGIVKFIALPKEYHEDEDVSVFFQKINKDLFEKKCKIQGIGHKSLKEKWAHKYPDKGYAFKFIDTDFPFDINIFEDSILLSLWGEQPIIIRVQDKEFVRQAKRFFEETWRS